jgi:dolichol-phosphate mannosyltransferase
MSLSLILPTLNERENIEHLVPELLRVIPELDEILVVDDGSTDGTPDAVRRLGASDSRVRLLERSGRPCLTASIQLGVRAARGDRIGWMDADLVIAPSDLHQLIAAVDLGADVAVGSRFVSGGRIKGQDRDGLAGRLGALGNLRNTEDSWLGVLLSWALNAVLLPGLVGLGVRDYTSGIIVARREALEDVTLRGNHGEYFIHLCAELAARGRRVVEIPYLIRARRFGVSKTGNGLLDYARRGSRYLSAGVAAGRIVRTRSPIGREIAPYHQGPRDGP